MFVPRRRGGVEEAAASRRLSIVIPYTTPELTKAALDAAGVLCRKLSTRATLVAVDIVPFPCPLHQTLVDPKHLERQLLELVRGTTIPVRVILLHARDLDVAYRRVLKPDSLILIATRHNWWRRPGKKLARRLIRAGYNVVIVSA